MCLGRSVPSIDNFNDFYYIIYESLREPSSFVAMALKLLRRLFALMKLSKSLGEALQQAQKTALPA